MEDRHLYEEVGKGSNIACLEDEGELGCLACSGDVVVRVRALVAHNVRRLVVSTLTHLCLW